MIVGTTESKDVDIKNPKGSYDVWVVMVSPSGQMIWENSYGGSLVDEASRVIEDSYGNFRIIGNHTAITFKLSKIRLHQTILINHSS